jgi:uncharacterized protein YfaS (alpha-2-macroglobulin family)
MARVFRLTGSGGFPGFVQALRRGKPAAGAQVKGLAAFGVRQLDAAFFGAA